MDTAQTPTIRNVALVGHSGAGKTTLAEALLHRAGVVPRLGRVEEGTTVCDTEPEEIKRGISLSPAIAPFLWTASDGLEYTINLIDTPGYADFAGGVDAALAVADLALVVVSAVDGVEVGTEIVWQQCAELGIPRMIFMTKEDKPRADFHRVLDQMRAAFGSGLVPLEIPIGEEEAFHGIADVLSDTGFGYDGAGQHHTEPIPDDVAAEEQRVHDEVAGEIVSGDDEQLERYLSGEVPSASELGKALVHEVRDCAEFPVLVGSALTGVGVDRLADYLCELSPSPADRPATVHAGKPDGPATEVDANPKGDPLLYVFRTVADPFVGQVSLFKLLSGTVANEDRLVNAVTGTEERLHGLFKLLGKEHLAVERIAAGYIGAVAKLAATPTGSTLAKRGMTVHVTGTPPRPTPYALALNPLTQADDDKLSSALQRLVGEDPTLVIDRSADSGQTILRGTGDTHIEVGVAGAAQDGLPGVRRPVDDQGRVLAHQALQGAGQLVVVGLRERVQGEGVRRRARRRARHVHGHAPFGQGGAGRRGRQLGDRADVAGGDPFDGEVLLAEQLEQAVQALLGARHRVDQPVLVGNRAGEHLEQRDLADERVGDGAEDVEQRVCLGVRVDLRRGTVRLSRVHGGGAVRRRRAQLAQVVSEAVDTDAGQCGADQHRELGAVAHLVHQGLPELARRRHLAGQVALQLLVVAGDDLPR